MHTANLVILLGFQKNRAGGESIEPIIPYVFNEQVDNISSGVTWQQSGSINALEG